MAHDLKNYARHVQRALEADEECTSIPTYSWCLSFVIREMQFVAGTPAERKEALAVRAKVERRAWAEAKGETT